MERSISPKEHLENLRIVLSTRDVELLVVFWYESWRLEELGEEVREHIMKALPGLAFDYGLAPVETFREFVQAYDEKMFVKECSDPVNRCLGFFAGRGDLRNVRISLKKGADKVDKALRKAAYGGHVEVVEFLLSRGATEVNWGLYGAAHGGYEDLVDFFLSKGAKGIYALYGALRGGHQELIERFLPDILFEEPPLRENASRMAMMTRRIAKDVRKQELDRAVYEAARGGNQEYVDFFLSKGAGEYEALRGAARDGHLNVVKYFLPKNAPRSIVLALAARGGHFTLVKYLVENGYNTKVYLTIALDDAARGGHEEVIEYLLEKGAEDEGNIVFGAAKGGHFLLLEKYLSPLTLEKLNLALRGATQGNYPDLAEWLIEKGADDFQGATRVAVRLKNESMIALLREKLGDGMPEIKADNEYWGTHTAQRYATIY